MKLVIYREKKTNAIKSFHEFTPQCTEERIRVFNAREDYPTKVEVVELEEGSLAYFFYTMKTARIEEEAERWQDLEDTIRNIASDIEDRLDDFARWLREEKKG